MIIQRGAVYNRARNIQVRDYSGLLYGKITPTDIDGHIEYKNRGFVYIETKHGDAEMPYGQRLAFERTCDDHRKPTLFILTKHDTPSDHDIDMANTVVIEYRYKKQWHKPKAQFTAKDLIDKFFLYLDRIE